MSRFFIACWDELQEGHRDDNIEGFVLARMIDGFPEPRRSQYKAFWDKLQTDPRRLRDAASKSCRLEYVVYFADDRPGVVHLDDDRASDPREHRRRPSDELPHILVDEFRNLNQSDFKGFYDVIPLKPSLSWASDSQRRRRLVWVTGPKGLQSFDERLKDEHPSLIGQPPRSVIRLFAAEDSNAASHQFEGIASRLLGYLETLQTEGLVRDIVRHVHHGNL